MAPKLLFVRRKIGCGLFETVRFDWILLLTMEPTLKPQIIGSQWVVAISLRWILTSVWGHFNLPGIMTGKGPQSLLVSLNLTPPRSSPYHPHHQH